MDIFTGSGVALVTPFDSQDRVNFSKLKELIEYHISRETDALIVTGTTGESSTLTDDEKLEIIHYTVKVVNKRIPVIAGTGSNNTKHAVELSKKAAALGVDGLLVVTPYYNKGNESGIYDYFSSIAKAVKCPIILYNVPSRTGVNLSLDILEKLSEIENIVALKEASGNMSYASEVARRVPKLSLYSGNDDITLPMLAIGAKGTISVSANILPELTHRMIKIFLQGNLKDSKDIQLKYNDLVNALFIETNPAPIKQAMNLLGFEVGHCRSPFGPMSEKNVEILDKILKSHGVKR